MGGASGGVEVATDCATGVLVANVGINNIPILVIVSGGTLNAIKRLRIASICAIFSGILLSIHYSQFMRNAAHFGGVDAVQWRYETTIILSP